MSRFIPKKTSKLWPYDEKVNDLPINPKFISQGNERSCVPCVLAMLTDQNPQYYYTIDNTNMVDWSNSINTAGIKLAFCISSHKYLDCYISELKIGTFIICIYTCLDEEILTDKCTSHAILVHNDTIFDSNNKKNTSTKLSENVLYGAYVVKNIFRVVPIDYAHGI